MYLGRIVETGEASRVLNAPLHPYTQALVSAIPSHVPKAKRDTVILKGDLPSPEHIPSGCRFHPRCPSAMEICRREHPAIIIEPGGTSVECHLYGTAAEPAVVASPRLLA
jgi:oligopeptide/dipeptide ABC transporter ATP-binding protein